jgi:hypothetical protein
MLRIAAPGRGETMERLRPSMKRGLALLLLLPASLTFFFLFASTGCFEEPAAPSWDVEIVIPLISRTETVLDIISEEGYLTWDSLGLDSLVQFSISDSISFCIQDEIRTEPLSQTVTQAIGEFGLGPFGLESLNVGLATLCPACERLLGTTSPVPPFVFTTAPIGLPEFADFDSLIIASGLVIVEMENRIPVTLEDVSLTLLSAGVTIGGPSAGKSIASGETAVETLQVVAGALVKNPIQVIIAGQSLGSGETPVYIPEDAGLDLAVMLSEIRVVEAWARFAALVAPIADTLLVEGIGDLDSAQVYQGALTGWATSYLAVDCSLEVRLPEVRSQSGSALTIEMMLPPGQSQSINHFLDGYKIAPESTGSSSVRLALEGDLILFSGGQKVHLTQSDHIELVVELGPVILEAAWGVLSPLVIEVPGTSEEVDLPDGLDAVEALADPRVIFELCRTIDLPVSLDSLAVTGINEALNPVTLEVDSLRLAPNPQPGLACTTFFFDHSNSNIGEFLVNLPERVEASGSAVIGDGVYHGSVMRGDHAHGRITCTFPLVLSLRSDTVRTDAQSVKLSQSIRDLLGEDLLRGDVVITITNHLPFGAGGTLYVGTDSATVFDEPLLVIPESGGVLIPAAPVGPDSLVSGPVADTTRISLDKSDLELFDRETLYTGIEIALEGTGGEVVKVVVSDYVRFAGRLHLTVRVDSD